MVVGVLVAGCSGAGGAPPPPQPRAVEPPPRPRDVRIDGVDPCSLLTAEQRVGLGLDGRAVFDLGPSELYGDMDVPACVVSGSDPRAITVGVSIVTSAGIDLFSSGDLAAEVRPADAQGFPAVVAVPARSPDWCTVVVDVAPGQLLDIQFADGGRTPPIPQPQLCRDAQTVAEAVMVTLLSVR